MLVCHLGGGQSSFDHVHVESLKDDWPPGERPGVSPRICLWDSFSACTCGQKIIDSPAPSMTDQDLTYNFLKLRFNMHMVTRWLTPQYDRPGSHLEFFYKIQHGHGQKMIDPPVWQTRTSPTILRSRITCTWSKMIDHGGDCYMKDLLPMTETTCC